MKVVYYRVTVHCNDPDRVEHEQEFHVKDHSDAKEYARQHAEHMKALWPEPDYSTYVTESVTQP